jgi:hypothetical protein
MDRRRIALSFLLLQACQASLPPAAVVGEHGVERLWIEALGLE